MTKTFLVLALLLSSVYVHAAQMLFQSSPTEATVATISRNEPNLLTVDGRKIRRIFGAEGVFTVQPEEDTGSAWLKPLTDKPLLTAYVTDEEGEHYKLLLKVADIPAETIIIKGRNVSARTRIAISKKNEPRNDDILNITAALYNGEGDSKSQVVPLWKGTRFELIRLLELRGVRGEEYVLTNTSDKRIVMDEREFYRAGVQAVVIEEPSLDAGETTHIIVISEVE